MQILTSWFSIRKKLSVVCLYKTFVCLYIAFPYDKSPRNVVWWQKICDLHRKSRIRVKIYTPYKNPGHLGFYLLIWTHKICFLEDGVFSHPKKSFPMISLHRMYEQKLNFKLAWIIFIQMGLFWEIKEFLYIIFIFIINQEEYLVKSLALW